MNITEQRTDSALALLLDGRLDTLTSPKLEEIVADDGKLEGLEELIIDMTDVEYVSSAGLRAVLLAHKAMEARDGVLVVRHPNEYVSEVFRVTGFSDVLRIEP